MTHVAVELLCHLYVLTAYFVALLLIQCLQMMFICRWTAPCRTLGSRGSRSGGKVVVLAGDFRQVLPVVPRGSRPAVVAATLPHSRLWPLITQLHLTTNMRVQQLTQQGQDATAQQAFSQQLLDVGEGTVGDRFTIPPSMRASSHDPHRLITTIFGDLSTNTPAAAAARSTEILISRAVLTPCNDTVDSLNSLVV